MARTVIITDDVTGQPGAKPRTVVIDTVEYEIDLTSASLAELKNALKPFLKNARVVKGGRPQKAASSNGGRKAAPAGRKPRAKTAPNISAEARAWALKNGVVVPKRGRVPASVIDAYRAAQ